LNVLVKEAHMQVLIIGEAGERPFYEGQSAGRLWRWFGVRDQAELVKVASLVNICPMKDFKFILPDRLESIRQLSSKADQVYLVGKFAQQYAYGGSTKHETSPCWTAEDYRWVGLPHPSGRNRQLNTLSDSLITYFIQGAYRERRQILCRKESSPLLVTRTSMLSESAPKTSAAV